MSRPWWSWRSFHEWIDRTGAVLECSEGEVKSDRSGIEPVSITDIHLLIDQGACHTGSDRTTGLDTPLQMYISSVRKPLRRTTTQRTWTVFMFQGRGQVDFD